MNQSFLRVLFSRGLSGSGGTARITRVLYCPDDEHERWSADRPTDRRLQKALQQ